MIDVVDVALARVLAPVFCDDSSNDPLRRNVEMFELQMKYDRIVAQLISVTTESDT